MILLNKKIKKVIFFKIPSFKISNTLGGSCPHIWLCNPHTRNWPKFFLDETHQYEHCDCKSSTSFDYSEPLTQKYIFVVICVLIFIHLGLAQHCLPQHWFPNSTLFNWFQKSSHSTIFSHFYHSQPLIALFLIALYFFRHF